MPPAARLLPRELTARDSTLTLAAHADSLRRSCCFSLSASAFYAITMRGERLSWRAIIEPQ